jgi:hypothetical protein
MQAVRLQASRKQPDMHSKDNSSAQQQQSKCMQSLQDVEEAHLSGHQGFWDDPAVKKRGETERHVSLFVA